MLHADIVLHCTDACCGTHTACTLSISREWCIMSLTKVGKRIMLIKRSPALTWCGIILVLTIFLALVLPVNYATLHRLHISLAIYHEAILSLLIPIGIIWFSAFYAYEKTGQYADTLRKTDE